jgi:hypothetical protein
VKRKERLTLIEKLFTHCEKKDLPGSFQLPEISFGNRDSWALKIALLLIGCCFLFSCHSKKHQFPGGDNIPVKDIKWKSQKDFEIKDLVEDIQYILLENKKECLFSEINKLIIENDRIYILDMYGTQSLLVFDITGKFLHKIGGTGGGPGEYTRYINFDVYDNIVYVNDFSNRRMLIFDKEGKYIKSVKSSFSFSDFYILEHQKYLLSLDHEENSNSNKIVITNDLKKKETAYFSFSRDFKNNKGNSRSFQSFQKKTAYMFPVSDTLYIFNEEGNVENGYFFDFGNQKLPERLKNDYTEATRQRRDNSYIYIYNTPVIINQYIFIDLFIGNQKYLAVFDLNRNEYAYELITPENCNVKNINFPLCAVDNSILVSYIDNFMYGIMKDKDLLDSKVIEHLSNDGVALCLYKLKQ